MGKPTHKIMLVDKYRRTVGARRHRLTFQVGVAWKAFEDSDVLTLQLNPGVVLDWKITEDYYINIKPYVQGESSGSKEPRMDEDGL